MGTSNVDDIYELTPLQRGMLLHTAHDGATDMYLSQQNYIAEGELDPDTLVEAWKAVVQAHPALRTSFHWEGMDKPLQVVHRHVDLPVHRHDWSDLAHEEQQKRLDQLRVGRPGGGFRPDGGAAATAEPDPAGRQPVRPQLDVSPPLHGWLVGTDLHG